MDASAEPYASAAIASLYAIFVSVEIRRFLDFGYPGVLCVARRVDFVILIFYFFSFSCNNF